MSIRLPIIVWVLLPLLTGCGAHARRVALERAMKEERDYRASRGFCVVHPEPDSVGDFLAEQGPEAVPLYQRLFIRYRSPRNARERQYLDVAMRGLVVFDLPRSLPKLEALALGTTGDAWGANRVIELLVSYASRGDAVRIVGKRLLSEREPYRRQSLIWQLERLGDAAALSWLKKAQSQEATWSQGDPARAELRRTLEDAMRLFRIPDTCYLRGNDHTPTGWTCWYFCPGPRSRIQVNAFQPCPETSPLPEGPRPEHPKAEPRSYVTFESDTPPTREFLEWREKLYQRPQNTSPGSTK